MTDTPDQEEPERKGLKCELCGKLTDVENITTIHGKFYCADCTEAGKALEELQPFRERYDRPSIRRTVLGCGIALVVFIIGSIVLLIYTFMRIDTLTDCKATMEKRVYPLLVDYAKDGAYPPNNNDLRVLFDRDIRLNLHLFECPGTTNTVTTREHLKDDSASPTGPGMSYFYQGGYGYVLEPDETELPLFWDQSPANHKGRGVNIIFKDGHHEYWKTKVPQLRPPGGSPPVDSGGEQ